MISQASSAQSILGQDLKDLPPSLWDSLETTLLNPLENFLSRPSKKIRAQLVQLGGLWSQPFEEPGIPPGLIEAVSQLIEWLHAGSLIIDDIQDNSAYRRTQPSLHRQLGVPKALNAGNWLYFWALNQIQNIELSEKQQLQVFSLCIEALSQGHGGQALDLGIEIDQLPQAEIPSVCRASLQLKSGVLVALALQLGGVLGGASAETQHHLKQWGLSLGIALQAFDDLGNFSMKPHSAESALFGKEHEDLILRRPSWIWWVAASHSSAQDFESFLKAVKALPNKSLLHTWAKEKKFHPMAKHLILSEWVSPLLSEVQEKRGATHPASFNRLKSLISQLEQAYESC